MEPILKQSGSRGQMTIEFALLFPVMLMIALIACNSILFLSECASFDRIFRESVCVFAPSPASEETTGQICAHIEEALAHKGWQALSGNNEYASNFYKATGRYHQLVLQYFTTQERTLVVITITEREQS